MKILVLIATEAFVLSPIGYGLAAWYRERRQSARVRDRILAHVNHSR